MNCDEVRPQLSDYAVGGLSRHHRQMIAVHLEGCAACRAELTALERTGTLLARLGLESAPPGTWAAVRYRIVERERARRPSAWVRGLALAGLAIAIALVALITFLPGSRRPPAEPEQTVVAQADEEIQTSVQGHFAATWSAPLADPAAVGLVLQSGEDDS